MTPFFFADIRTQEIKFISFLTGETEDTRLEMKNQVKIQLLKDVRQLQKNVREQISTMIGQMEENINEAFESLE